MPKPASLSPVIALWPHYLIKLSKCKKHAGVFILVFAYAVHLITSAGELTAAAQNIFPRSTLTSIQ